MSSYDLIDFSDWVSKNYTPDNGIGFWVPSDNIDGEPITSKELVEIYLDTIKYIKPYRNE
jgi:hypothetical protein